MKRLTAMLFATWLILGLAFLHDAAAEEGCVMYVHVRDGSFLNGRREPNLQSPILMTMERGFEAHVIGVKNGWAEIEGGEAGTAWCCVDYLADYRPGEDAPLYTVVSDGRVRVRQSPDGKTVDYVWDGDTVKVRFVIDGWAYIGRGYVMAEFLEERK
jgi:hypothetical protein